MSPNKTDWVCVTGAAGFIGTHVTRVLLERGYRVRATVRDAKDEQKVAHLRSLVPDTTERLEIFSANLTEPGSFDVPVDQCQAVFHVASVIAMQASDPQREIVDVAVEGTRNVLLAAQRSGTVKRFVITSSVAAVAGEHRPKDHVFTEEDWCDDARIESNPYSISKARAERLAWDVVARLPRDQRFELVSINPSVCFGPVYAACHLKSSPVLLYNPLVGKLPGCPRMNFGTVDVRDVAEAQVRAFENPDARGRYILHHTNAWWKELCELMKARHPTRKIPTRQLPDAMTLTGALLDRDLSFGSVRRSLGRVIRFDSSRVREELGIVFRPLEDSVNDCTDSILERDLA